MPRREEKIRMLWSENIVKTLRYVAVAHDPQKDKLGVPYLVHLIETANGVHTEEETIVALLHDFAEDIVPVMNKEQFFGFLRSVLEFITDEELEALWLLKHQKGTPYAEYIKTISESGNQIAINVKKADLASNSQEDRLSLLPQDKQEWLRNKYQKAKTTLGEWEHPILAIKDEEGLCWNCLRKHQHINRIEVPELGFWSIFDGYTIEIHLCDDCLLCSKPGLWSLKTERVGKHGGYHYVYEAEMFGYIDRMPMVGKQFVLNEFAHDVDRPPIPPQDWLDYRMKTLPYERAKALGLLSNEEIIAYRKRFPKCVQPILMDGPEDDNETCCPYGAKGDADQNPVWPACAECYQCRKYVEE